jgi:hypothetical protein
MRILSTYCLMVSSVGLLEGCVVYQHEAQSKSGNYERDLIVSVGGTSSQKGADGSTFVHDHQASFKDAAQGAVSVAGGLAAASVSKAKTASDNAAATAQQAATLKAQMEQARIAAQSSRFSQAAGAGLFTSVPLPTR